jgi:hypothetical protein
MGKRRRVPIIPPPPTLEEAMVSVQTAADRSMLPQYPYAEHLPGVGWWVGSACTDTRIGLDEASTVFYPVAVLPSEYFRPATPLW